jgi:CheY-like chemotaxis protein
LKEDLSTRHIPVFIITATEQPENPLKHGALRFLTKPIAPEAVKEIFEDVRQHIETKAKKLLLIEDDEDQRNSIRELIGNGTAHLSEAANADEALRQLSQEKFDCVVLDLILPDMSGFELINRIREEYAHLPIIVYTGKDLSRELIESARNMRICRSLFTPAKIFPAKRKRN